MSTTAGTPTRSASQAPRRLSVVATAALALALLGIVLLALAGLGTRWGWWPFPTGFRVLGWGFYLECAAVLVGIVGAVVARPGGGRRGFRVALLGLVVGLVGAGVMVRWLVRARSVPPIHDITTDVVNPPLFVAVLPLRKDAANPAAYGGQEVAAQQQRGYPDIRPLVTPRTPEQVYPLALDVARQMGMTIDAAVPAEGRIEATATTFWFGFKDDVVVRISRVPEGSRVDVRSVSRVGGSDVGTNAHRVREYLKRLQG